MRRNLAEPFATNQAREFVARKQILDRPDADVTRFQHVPFLGTHGKPNAVSADPLRFADSGHKVFWHIDFQHSHDLAPVVSRNLMLHYGECGTSIFYLASGKFVVSPSCAISIFDAAADFERPVESKTLIESGAA